MARVRWSLVARRDFRAALERLISAPGAARMLRARVGNATQILRSYPLLGRVVPEYQDQSVRELIVQPYRLIYRVDQDEIIILTMVHGGRDLSNQLRGGPWDIE